MEYAGPTISKGTVGKETRIETYDTFKAKYRLLITFDRDTGEDCSYDLGSWTAYEISIIDNEAGIEIFTLSGRNNCATIVDQFMEQFK